MSSVFIINERVNVSYHDKYDITGFNKAVITRFHDIFMTINNNGMPDNNL